MLFSIIDLFSGAIIPLIVLAVFCLLKRVEMKKIICVVLFILYFSAVLDIVGIPYAQSWTWKPIINLLPFSDLPKEAFSFWSVFQFAANMVLFIPFGMFLPAIWKRFRSFWATVATGFLTSVCIETAQLFSFRVTAVDDLLMNTLGTAIGYMIIAALSKKSWKKHAAATDISAKGDIWEFLILAGIV